MTESFSAFLKNRLNSTTQDEWTDAVSRVRFVLSSISQESFLGETTGNGIPEFILTVGTNSPLVIRYTSQLRPNVQFAILCIINLNCLISGLTPGQCTIKLTRSTQPSIPPG